MRELKTNCPYINLKAVQIFSNLNKDHFYDMKFSLGITEVNFIPNFTNILQNLDTFLKSCKDKNFNLILCESNIDGIADDLEVFARKYNVKILAEYSENIIYKDQLKNLKFINELKGAAGA